MTPQEAAAWLLEEVRRRGLLTHEEARSWLEQADPSLLKRTSRGHLIIRTGVLRRFRKIRGDTVIWSVEGEFWRLRQPGESLGVRAVLV